MSKQQQRKRATTNHQYLYLPSPVSTYACFNVHTYTQTGLAGSYRLSSYYIAKMIGELPLVIALPSAFHLISYPLLGYHSFYTFISLWGFAILK